MFMIIFSLGCLLVILVKDYFIMFLFFLEMLLLLIIYYLMICLTLMESLIVYLMVMAVCDGVLGLSLLVKMNNSLGHQMIKFLDI
uniref:NADH dehydrogenase subunit 4L n=1 Tax=Melecta chinensis TaxID=582934 RepID=UPI002551DF37|nr:NADH dehydrogenase subunit 4L [Melecta chinensis]WFP44659.1 NADH dehydrogenase subunit 4L [Melecta chinensis]